MDYGAITTYVMPDSVVAVVPPESVITTIPFDHCHDRQILDQTAEHLAALGYTRLDTYDPDNPPTSWSRSAASGSRIPTSTSAIRGGITGAGMAWPCCYGPGWGVGYPVVTATQYDVGTIAIDMWDVRRTDTTRTKRIPTIWVAALRGLLEGSGSRRPGPNRAGLDRAFEQSPYLGHP